MWSILDKITEQVTKFSTFFGQLWYILVFVFRLIVVVTLGGAVYGDEQSSFKCDHKHDYCGTICYNQFAKMSHLRFWGFQLLAVTFPTVLFHFFSLYISSEIEKINELEKAIGFDPDNQKVTEIDGKERELKKISRKKKAVGKVKTKKVYSGGSIKEVQVTNKIYVAYFISTVMKLALEAVFIYFSYTLYYIEDPRCKYENALADHETIPKCDDSFVDHVLMNRVPPTYTCTDDGADFRTACATSGALGWENAVVTCFPSRPYEKTVFLRYMNILSFVCLLLCVLELLYMPIKYMLRKAYHNRPKKAPQTVYIYRNPPPEMNWGNDTASTAGESVVNRRSIAYTETKP